MYVAHAAILLGAFFYRGELSLPNSQDLLPRPSFSGTSIRNCLILRYRVLGLMPRSLAASALMPSCLRRASRINIFSTVLRFIPPLFEAS